MKKLFLVLFLCAATLGLFGLISIVAADDYQAVPVQSDVVSETVNIGTDEFLSEIKQADIDVWMIGAKVRSDSPDIKLSVRTSTDMNNWTDWTGLVFNENTSDSQYIFADPIALPAAGRYVQYRLSSSYSEIASVELILLDPTAQTETWLDQLRGYVSQAFGQEDVDIITRQQWGADESIMFWYDDMEHEDIDKIIIHHTAADDSTPIDPPAVIRGIYYFHTVTRGWGDIGYNYLVDQYGNIYEGRRGGLGVVAAHALGSNYGSVGISVLGNYMNDYPADDTLTSLASLISFVNQQTGVPLNSNTVLGHRDVDATACPGDHLYADIPGIILDTITSPNPSDYQAMLLSVSQEELAVSPEGTATVEIEYLNAGQTAWLYTDPGIYLVPSKPYPRSSQFVDKSWISASKVTGPDHDSIMPNTAGKFLLKLKAPADKDFYVENFALAGPDGLIPGTDVSIKVTVSDQPVITNDPSTKNPKGIGAHNYHYLVKNISSNVHIVKGNTGTIFFELENTGVNNWFDHGLFPFRIGTWDAMDHASQFYNPDDWLSPNRVNLPATAVAPGEIVRFAVNVKTDNLNPGVYTESFKGVIDGLTWLDDEPFTVKIYISEPEYHAVIQNQNSSLRIKSGQTAHLWLDVTNMGNSPWDSAGSHPLTLTKTNQADSQFYNYNYWINQTQPDIGDQLVAPGLTTRLFVLVTAPDQTGDYHECFDLALQDLADLNQTACWDIEVIN